MAQKITTWVDLMADFIRAAAADGKFTKADEMLANLPKLQEALQDDYVHEDLYVMLKDGMEKFYRGVKDSDPRLGDYMRIVMVMLGTEDLKWHLKRLEKLEALGGGSHAV